MASLLDDDFSLLLAQMWWRMEDVLLLPQTQKWQQRLHHMVLSASAQDHGDDGGDHAQLQNPRRDT